MTARLLVTRLSPLSSDASLDDQAVQLQQFAETLITSRAQHVCLLGPCFQSGHSVSAKLRLVFKLWLQELLEHQLSIHIVAGADHEAAELATWDGLTLSPGSAQVTVSTQPDLHTLKIKDHVIQVMSLASCSQEAMNAAAQDLLGEPEQAHQDFIEHFIQLASLPESSATLLLPVVAVSGLQALPPKAFSLDPAYLSTPFTVVLLSFNGAEWEFVTSSLSADD